MSLSTVFADARRHSDIVAKIQRSRGYFDQGRTIPGATAEIASEIPGSQGFQMKNLLGMPVSMMGRRNVAFPVSLESVNNMLYGDIKKDSEWLGAQFQSRNNNDSLLPQEYVEELNKNYKNFSGFRDFDVDKMLLTSNTDSWRFASELIASYITFEAPATHACAALALAVGVMIVDDMRLSGVLRAAAHFHIFNQDGGFFESDPENASEARFTAATMSHYSVSAVREAYGATVEINVMYLTRPEVIVGAYYRLACAYWTKINEIQLRHLIRNAQTPSVRPNGDRAGSNKYTGFTGMLNPSKDNKPGIEKLISIVEGIRPSDAEGEYRTVLVPIGTIPDEMMNNTYLSQSLEVLGPSIDGNLPLRYARMSNGVTLFECSKLSDVEGRTVTSYFEYVPIPSGVQVGIHVREMAEIFHRVTRNLPEGLQGYFPEPCAEPVRRDLFTPERGYRSGNINGCTPFVVPPIAPDVYSEAASALCMRHGDDTYSLEYRWGDEFGFGSIDESKYVRSAGSYAMTTLVSPQNAFLEDLSAKVLSQFAVGYGAMDAAELYLMMLSRFGPSVACQDTFTVQWDEATRDDIVQRDVEYDLEEGSGLVRRAVKRGEVARLDGPHSTKFFVERYWLDLTEIPKFIHTIVNRLKRGGAQEGQAQIGQAQAQNGIEIPVSAEIVAALSLAIDRTCVMFSSEDIVVAADSVNLRLTADKWRILLEEILRAYCIRIGAYPRNMSEAALFAAAALIQNNVSSWNKLTDMGCPLPLDLMLLVRRDLIGSPVIALVNNPDSGGGDNYKRSLVCIVSTKQKNTVNGAKFDSKPGVGGNTIGNEAAALLQQNVPGMNTTSRIHANTISSITVRFQMHIIASPERPPIKFEGAYIVGDLALTKRITPEDAGALVENYASWANEGYSIAVVPMQPGVRVRDDTEIYAIPTTVEKVLRVIGPNSANYRDGANNDVNAMLADIAPYKAVIRERLTESLPWYVTHALESKAPYANITFDGPVTAPYKEFESPEYQRKQIAGRITRAEHVVFDKTQPLGPISAVKTSDMPRGGTYADVAKEFTSSEHVKDPRHLYPRISVHQVLQNRRDAVLANDSWGTTSVSNEKWA